MQNKKEKKKGGGRFCNPALSEVHNQMLDQQEDNAQKFYSLPLKTY